MFMTPNIEGNDGVGTERSDVSSAVMITMTGTLANTRWRSVPWRDLRAHPFYRSLPQTDEVSRQLASVSSSSIPALLQLFRQDSWQWEELHCGRLTTSKLASVLGFYESQASAALNIPKSLQGHDRAIAAWNTIRIKPPRDWKHLFRENETKAEVDIDCESMPWAINRATVDDVPLSSNTHILSSSASNTASLTFVCDYAPDQRTHEHEQAMSVARDHLEARLQWGKQQEATALLSIVNCLADRTKYSLDSLPESVLHEAGMFTAEWLQSTWTAAATSTPSTDVNAPQEWMRRIAFYQRLVEMIFVLHELPLIGASPDGIISHPLSSSIEVVEVKCTSPFQSLSSSSAKTLLRNNANDRQPTLRACRSRDPLSTSSGIPAWHVPQLQWEMLCAGPHCESALLIVCAIDGAVIYRMKRADEYISDMITLVRNFFGRFVKDVPTNRMKPPPVNFFATDSPIDYKRFLRETTRLAKEAIVVQQLSEEEMQRSPWNQHFFHDKQ